MNDVQKIKEQVDIVSIISQYLELKQSGTNLRGLCPFHNEKSPSFMVNTNLQIFKCFGCGKGGDVFSFIQEIERLDFNDALNLIAEKTGIQLNQYKKDDFKENKKNRILEVNSITAKFYNYILKSHQKGKDGRTYALKRGIDSFLIENFLFGYAPKGKTNLLNFLVKKGFQKKELVEFGLAIERDGEIIDKFRERLLQPIRNIKGDILGFSGRYTGTFKDAPKYVNSPETLLFKKSDILYGIYEGKESIRRKKQALLVEGNLDVVSAHKIGIENIIAPLGTAFTENHAKLLKRFVDEAILAFDTDNAGLNATIKAIAILEKYNISHKILDLSKFKDIDEFVNTNPNELLENIKNPKNSIDYIIKIFTNNIDMGSVEGKQNFLTRMIPIIKSITDPIQLNQSKKDVSLITELSPAKIEQILNKNQTINKFNNSDLQTEIKTLTNQPSQDHMYMHYIALLIECFRKKIDIPDEIIKISFINGDLGELINIVIENKGEFHKDKLLNYKENIKNLVEEVSLMDTAEILEPRDELISIWKRLYKEKIKQDIFQIRKQININDDPLLADQLKSLIIELSKL